MLSHPLWSSPVPHALGTEPQDIPTLTAYLPPSDKRNGASMLVLPGGGYGGLAPHEGQGYAEWFAAHGITLASPAPARCKWPSTRRCSP